MKNLALPIILIILSVGLFVMYIKPVYAEIKVLQEESAQYDEVLNKSKELRELRDTLLNQYNSFDEGDLSKIKKMLPDNIDNVRLVMDIDNMASKYGITIKGIKIEESTKDSGEGISIAVPGSEEYDFVVLNLSFLSNYDNFVSFMKDLSNSLRLVDIVNVSFEVPDAKNIDVYEYNVGIKTYWLK